MLLLSLGERMESKKSGLYISRRKFLGCCGIVAGAGTLAGSGLLAEAVYDTGDVQETTVDISVPGLPAAFDGLIITQLSDLHIHSFGDIERRVVSLLQKRSQQLIAITGDFVDDDSGIEAALRLVKSLHAEFGIWAIPGNVDYYGPYDYENQPPIFQQLRRLGVHLLINQHGSISASKGERLYLLGSDDPVHGYADIGQALQGMPADVPHILMAHSPDIVEYDHIEQMSLVFAGHTHGGQICLPLVPPAIDHSGPSMNYPAGLFKVGPTHLYVNRGIGTSHIPLRFACRPEITYVRLHTG